ncbi:MAG: alpha/beta fold hydrolase [bacterium]
MKGELCRVITADGLELQGLFVAPAGGPAKTTVVHIHGLSGNFYENRFVDHMAEAAIGAGANFIATNNRGHEYISDFICEAPSGAVTSKQIGGAFEVFEDCPKDIQAWVDFAKARGAERVVLEGHSHGALKATHYLSKVTETSAGSGAHSGADPGAQSPISGLVLLSPSDDFGLQRYRMGRRFDEILGIVKKMVDEGRGAEFIPRDYFHYHLSAATYYDTFRPESALKIFNISMTDTHRLPALESVKVPVLLLVGSVEESFVGRPDEFIVDVKRRLKKTKDFTGQVIKDAPHNYLGYEAELAGHLGAWLKGHFGG